MRALQRYSDSWRRNRKLFQQNFRQATINRFYPVQSNKVHEFLLELIETPDRFMRHVMAYDSIICQLNTANSILHRLSQGIVFSSLYGLAVHPEDPIAQKSIEIVQALGVTQIPGYFAALERFPWLRFMPNWFPGCGFKQLVDQSHKGLQEFNTVPFDMAVDDMVRVVRQCVARDTSFYPEERQKYFPAR